MGTTRFILFVSLGLVLTMIWQAWQEDYGGQYKDVETESVVADQPVVEQDVPEWREPVETDEDIPTEGFSSLAGTEEPASNTVNVVTDVLDLKISTRGATIQDLSLLDYPVSKKFPDQPVALLKNAPNDFYLVQGGLLSKQDAANHKTEFNIEKEEYMLGDQEEMKVPFTWVSDAGLRITKTFTFYRGQYIADVDYRVENNTQEKWVGRAYGQINRTDLSEGGSKLIYTYTGAVISSPDSRYEKIDFDEIRDDPLSADIRNGWVAMLQHYFIVALIPGSKEEQYHYYTLYPERKSYVIGAITPPKTVSTNAIDVFNHRVYFGPKTQSTLKTIAEGLDLTVDYGIFWIIAKPLFWLLEYINGFTHNWGWSIVLVTLLLKLIFYRLSAAGYRSMANMRRVQPRLLAIRERFKDDRARLNQAMMGIYKEEKINPLGGCFPILVQIPVFISLYWVLLESVELRQADFILWINDLSIPDPYFVLPLLMGVTMFIQQKLNPAPLDPIQEKVLAVLPIVFTVFFAFFPSGLVLYWVVNNILSIAQQRAIIHSLEKAGPSK